VTEPIQVFDGDGIDRERRLKVNIKVRSHRFKRLKGWYVLTLRSYDEETLKKLRELHRTEKCIHFLQVNGKTLIDNVTIRSVETEGRDVTIELAGRESRDA
jgi:hypothetical protein